MDDTMLAIALGLFSAVTLATANMSVKMGTDILVGRAILSSSAALLIAPFALLVPLPDKATWIALGWAIPAHYVYQRCLVKTMERGDLSLVFPVMRGLAPLLTAGTAMIALGETLNPAAHVGLLLATVSVGVFALPPSGTAMLRHPDAAALFWALMTAICISLYNVADARGVRIAPEPLTFIVWLFLLDWISITATALLLRRTELRSALRLRWRYGVAAGIASILSFGASTYAYSLMETAKVSALRETSVVFAAIMGARLLGEGFGRRRTVAAVTLAAGLVTMQFAG